MKEREYYEINLAELFAVCLMKWRLILAFILIVSAAVLGIKLLTFEAPPPDSLEYRKIEKAIINRRITEEKIESEKKSYEENQFYGMNPQNIVKKKITIAVELADQSQITDQIDPTDMVLYAYQNMARTELRWEVLVPEVITKLQAEQLLDISYDTSLNVLTVSMISDDESLIDTVMAVAVEWYTGITEKVIEQTQEHKLTVFPLAVTVYDRETVEDMVSTVDAEAYIRSLEDKIEDYNTILDETFEWSEDTCVTMSVEELQEKFEEKKENESSPGVLSTLVMSGFFSACVILLYVCGAEFARGVLHGDARIEESTGWKRIGRINALSAPRDVLEKISRRMLYHNFEANPASLMAETRSMTSIFLEDAGIKAGNMVALVGDISEEDALRLMECLGTLEFRFQTSALCRDRVGANRLCRDCEAVIFIGKAERVCNAEVDAMREIASYTGKVPIGYILV